MSLQNELDRIDALNIYDIWQEVFNRLYPNQLYRNKNKDNLRSPSEYYQRIDVFQYVDGQEVFTAKFPFALYTDEETQYKNLLKDEVTAADQAEQVKQQILDLLIDIELNVAAGLLGLDKPNAAIYRNELIQSGNLAQAQELKDAYDIWKAEQDIIAQESQAIQDGVAAIEKGKKVVAYINFLNRQKNLTVEQFQQILLDADLQLIERLCLNGSIVSARFQISQYTPDGILITQDDKDKILAFIDRS
jgi:hypothetical protein